MKKLAELKSEFDRCVRCGSCRSGCPTFSAGRREGFSARGRLSVIKAGAEGTLDRFDYFKTFLRDCTLCGACTFVCPNGVDTPAVVLSARAETVGREGLPYGASFFLKHVLDSPRLGSLAMKLASRLQGFFLKEAGGGGGGGAVMEAGAELSGLVSRFSLPYIGEGRLVPPLAETFFLDIDHVKKLSGHSGSNQKGVATPDVSVAFFAGCGINYLAPHIGEKALEVLGRVKERVEVSVPRSQVCCGMPALAMGDVETARSLALKNLTLLESDVDYITTACATCSCGLKNIYDKLGLANDPLYRDRVSAFTSKVCDITDLLQNVLTLQAGNSTAVKEAVTYHDPCHLSRGLGLRDEPRELIEKAGADLREMKNPCRCCGFGGGLGYSNYELSTAIIVEKAENIRNSGANVVATACPGCIYQIKDGLNRIGSNVRVKHVLELF
jgi:glycolate oxidase iron-sulfur subunit